MKNPSFLLLAAIYLISNSCTKKIEACIDGPKEVEESTSATYTWCGDHADNIEWSMDGSNVLAIGKSFTPFFVLKGKHTIIAKATNKKYEKSASYVISYGSYPKTTCSVKNACKSGDQTLSNGELAGYKGYIYNSREDWMTDVANNKHDLAEEATDISYDNLWQNAFFSFKKKYPIGSKKLVSIENSNGISNWNEIFNNQGFLEIKYGTFTEGDNNNSGATMLDNNSMYFLSNLTSGMWRLTKIMDYSNSIPLDCKGDDYLKFKLDGTWKYELGENDCNGSSQTSSGTYGSIPTCNSSFNNISTQNGGFVITKVEYSDTQMIICINNVNSKLYTFSHVYL